MESLMRPEYRSDPVPLVEPFPRPGPSLRLAYTELDIAENGTAEQCKALGSIADLPRPWSPATCTKPQLRVELWNWLDAVVIWINHELVFDPVDVIPSCWPKHAHLVHEIAVLADLRRRADLALSSDALEEWHRYALPSFLERMRHRVADHCTNDHPNGWPSAGRFSRHLSDGSTTSRQQAFAGDLNTVRKTTAAPGSPRTGPSLRVVDQTTGEILD